MSNKQNDIIAEQQAEREYDIKLMQLELQSELSKILVEYGINVINQIGKDGDKVFEITKNRKKITNLFRKYKEAI